MTVKAPSVQTAKPALRMPDEKYLTKSFWDDVLSAYATLTEQPISLGPWTDLKKLMLE
jgi:hypothetical protein